MPRPTLCLLSSLLFAGFASLAPAADKPVDFVDHVVPILQKHCFSCHGEDKAEGGLRLDLKKHALTGGDSGAVILPGKSAESRLIALVSGLDRPRTKANGWLRRKSLC